MAGTLAGMITGMAGAGAGAGLGATLGAGLQGALSANPITKALGGLAGGPSGVAAGVGNPLTRALLSGAQNGFTAPNTGASAPVLNVPVINATPAQGGGGAVSPDKLWSDLHTVGGFDDVHSAAILGNMKQESELRPGIVNQNEGAQGLIQWRQGRLAGLKQFAASNGMSPTDATTQVAFLRHEMQTTESPAGQRFLSATTLPEANAALKSYIRYGSPPDKGGVNTRLANAEGYYKQFTGNAAPQATTAGVARPSTAPAAPTAASSIFSPTITPGAQPFSPTPVNPAANAAQKVANVLQAQRQAQAAQPVAAAPGAPQVQGGNIAAQRKEALLSPALELLAKLKQQGQSTPPVITGPVTQAPQTKSPVTV